MNLLQSDTKEKPLELKILQPLSVSPEEKFKLLDRHPVRFPEKNPEQTIAPFPEIALDDGPKIGWAFFLLPFFFYYQFQILLPPTTTGSRKATKVAEE